MPQQHTRKKHFHVLLVEDDQTETELVRQALYDTSVQHDLPTATDGVQAVQFVKREGEYESAPRPDLVLLDLSLPRYSGHDVLQTLKVDPDLRSIPVVILSGSQEEKDVWRAYHLHANAYVVKPHSGQDFLTALQRLVEFYCLHTQLAPASQPNGNRST